ncbi:hypothetical protein HAX54_036962 [Datura stramonium]|uniref:Uncharacterized protein n=1 Tax=Datura stramonium TaxID=4076 RepID=A0ABS8SH00_DATST|nr:hypothetical protein [Datura stramonium]
MEMTYVTLMTEDGSQKRIDKLLISEEGAHTIYILGVLHIEIEEETQKNLNKDIKSHLGICDAHDGWQTDKGKPHRRTERLLDSRAYEEGKQVISFR